MALSVFQDPQGIEWPIGFVAVATPGTPVNLMVNVDPSNNNAPGRATSANSSEYTPRAHKIFIQGYHPGANNNGMVVNAGNVYVMRSLGPQNQNSGGPQNRSDSGAMVMIIGPGGGGTLLDMEMTGATISPYKYSLDADVAGEGALITLVGNQRG